MRLLTTLYTSIVVHPRNQVITTWYRLSIVIRKTFAPANAKLTEEVKVEENSIKCRNCGYFVNYTPDNTVIFYFTDYPWYSAAQTYCHHCDYKQALFLFPNLEWEIRWAIENEIGFIELDGLPPEHVLDSFSNTFPDMVCYSEVTEAQEKEVAFFAWVMEHDPIERWFDEEADTDE